MQLRVIVQIVPILRGVDIIGGVIPNIGTNNGLTWRYLTLSKDEVEMIK